MSIGATEPVTLHRHVRHRTDDRYRHRGHHDDQQAADKDMFLQLLVAQMKYQDPMNPTDSSAVPGPVGAVHRPGEDAGRRRPDRSSCVASQMAFGASGLVGRTVSWTNSRRDGHPDRAASAGVTFGTDGPCSTSAAARSPWPGPVRQGGTATAASATTSRPPPARTGTTTTTSRLARTHPPRGTTMLRSLFAGISGLRANQTMLDVTGNNIANANTAGFKASTTVFQDTLSQMLTAAGGANAAQRRHQPDPGRPRRPGRRHQHQLQPGLGPDDRPADRPDDPGRRHVRRHRRTASSSTPAPAPSPSTRPAPW